MVVSVVTSIDILWLRILSHNLAIRTILDHGSYDNDWYAMALPEECWQAVFSVFANVENGGMHDYQYSHIVVTCHVLLQVLIESVGLDIRPKLAT